MRSAAFAAAALAGVWLAGCASSANRPAPVVVPRVAPTAQPGPVEPSQPEAALGEPTAAGSSVNAPNAKGPGVTAAAGAEPAASGAVSASGAGLAHAPGTASTPREVLIGTVSGTRLELSELLGAWLRRDGAGVRALLDDLVLSRIVELETGRLGAALPAGAAARAFEKRRDVLSAEAARAGELSLEDFIRSRLGLEPALYFKGLERELSVDLLAARVVRAWLLTSERAEVRVIAVATPEARDRVQAKLAAGQAFDEVARELSEDPSREEGGRMTPVVRGESTLARLAFATAVGEVAGPLEERGRFLFMQVEAKPRPLGGTWASLGPEVEASLAARGVEDPEYWQWQQAMQALYEVDLEPFRALVGGRP